jgi:hypothetical protein
MKDSYPSIGLVRLCRLLGVTRQAFYQHGWHSDELNIETELIIQEVIDIRKRHPMIGTRKLYFMLQSFWLLINYWCEEGKEEFLQLSPIIGFINILILSGKW